MQWERANATGRTGWPDIISSAFKYNTSKNHINYAETSTQAKNKTT
jgi:hypothetical protein